MTAGGGLALRRAAVMAGGPAVLALLAACGSGGAPAEAAPEPEPVAAAVRHSGEFPDGLAAYGDGYPESGDPCRKLGEGEATADWLAGEGKLVGCPSRQSADALGGSIVDTLDGFFIVSVPVSRDAGKEARNMLESGGFDATAPVGCAIADPDLVEVCVAGVRREWGPEGTTLVEVTRPDGTRRALFFDGAAAYGAESARADGSAGWTFRARHSGGKTIITFGPERYAIPDELVIG